MDDAGESASRPEGAAQSQAHPFQAEVAELLNLMVHSVYSETDIFLRELISNGSDACDKLRYEAIARPELLAGADKFAIRITPDKANGTLSISNLRCEPCLSPRSWPPAKSTGMFFGECPPPFPLFIPEP